MSEGYVGGYRMDLEDTGKLSNTALAMLTAATPENLPPEMGISKWMQIENQGSVGSCAGHARTSVLELGVYHQTKGTIVQLCREFAYITGQLVDGIRGDNGSTIMGHAIAAQKVGTCEEKYWPYSGRYDTNIPAIAYEKAKDYILNTHVVCHSYDDVFRFLALGLGGVQIGINWTLSNSAAPVETYSARGSQGGHSVAFLDWSPKLDNQGRRYLRLFNSWGPSWGEKGTRLVSPTAIEQMFQDGNTVMIGFSDMKDLKPRSVSWIGEGSVF